METKGGGGVVCKALEVKDVTVSVVRDCVCCGNQLLVFRRRGRQAGRQERKSVIERDVM